MHKWIAENFHTGKIFDQLILLGIQGFINSKNVAKVGTAYAVVDWLTLQLKEIILPTFNAPQWIAQTIIFVVIMGFPFAGTST